MVASTLGAPIMDKRMGFPRDIEGFDDSWLAVVSVRIVPSRDSVGILVEKLPVEWGSSLTGESVEVKVVEVMAMAVEVMAVTVVVD